MNMSNVPPIKGRLTARLTKGSLLAIWIVILVYAAVLAGTGKVSKFLFSEPLRHQYTSQNSCVEYLQIYLHDFRYPPPIESVLDALMKNPSWSDRSTLIKGSPEQINQQYWPLFEKITIKLNEIAREKLTDLKSVQISIAIPEALKLPGESSIQEISLPPGAQIWVSEEMKRIERAELIDTFFLLIVLGAFGSLIFLTKEYIDKEDHLPLSAYIFRPILGMFLALGMFVIDAMAHTILSNASILQVRREPLLVLAFAAGLLSEHAYDVISIRAKTAIDRLREETKKTKAEKPPASG
jgi:hypothetical protein